MLILNIFVSFGRSLGDPSRQALMIDVTPTSERGRLFGTFGSVSNIFRFASPGVGAFLWETNGPIYPFYLAGAVRLSAALLMLAILREPKKRET